MNVGLFSTRIKIGECSLSQKKEKKIDKCQKPTKRQINKEQKTGFFLFLRNMQVVF